MSISYLIFDRLFGTCAAQADDLSKPKFFFRPLGGWEVRNTKRGRFRLFTPVVSSRLK